MKRTLALLIILVLFSCTACQKDVGKLGSPISNDSDDSGYSETLNSEENKGNINETNTEISNTSVFSSMRTENSSTNKPSSNSTESRKTQSSSANHLKSTSSIAKSKTIYYTVVYNANGGWGKTTSSSHQSNEERALSVNGFKNAGYEFLGWNTAPTATTALYKDKQRVENICSVNNAVVQLYAIWRKAATAKFDDCMPTSRSRQTAQYHVTAMDNQGNMHYDATIVSNSRYNKKIDRSDERFVNGKFTTIKGTVFLRDVEELDSITKVRLVIEADGEIIYRSAAFEQYSGPQSFQVNISGVNAVYIKVSNVGNLITNLGAELIIDNLTLVR